MHVTKAALIGFCVLGSKMTSLAKVPTAYLLKQQPQNRVSPSHQFIHIHYPFGFIAAGVHPMPRDLAMAVVHNHLIHGRKEDYRITGSGSGRTPYHIHHDEVGKQTPTGSA